jgi:ABC transport system ATP-binding/permease protein
VIFVEQKPEAGREQPVEEGTTLGRDGCDVNLIDPEVSRRHAAIRTSGGSLAIEDLGSTNGTFVNEERIAGVTVLSHGDTVRLGATVWTVSIDDATSAQPAAAVAAEPAPPAPAPAGPRGDVEKPPEVAPSAIRRVLPPPAPGRAPAFSAPTARSGGGSAATRVEATIVCMVIIAAVAVALIVYFATY